MGRRVDAGDAYDALVIGNQGANFSAGADIKMMSSIGERPALMLRSANFLELFQWMGELLCQYSMSRPGDKVQVPAPTWAEVRT